MNIDEVIEMWADEAQYIYEGRTGVAFTWKGFLTDFLISLSTNGHISIHDKKE